MSLGRAIDLVLTILFFGLGMFAMLGVRQFPFADQLFPVTAAVLMIVCSVVYGIRVALGRGRDNEPEDPGAGAPEMPFSRNQIGSVLGPVFAVMILVAGVLIIGHLIAVPLFVFGYMKVKREPLWIAALGALVMLLFIRGLLIEIMHVPMPHPLLGNWLPF